MTRCLAPAVALLLAWVSAACGQRPSAPAAQPNIVLITLESLRTDHVGAYGGVSRTRPEIAMTPVLDAMAAEAVVYTDAHAVTSWTLASHASLFTGHYPTAHQTTEPLSRLGDDYQTVAELLAAAGYQTAAVVSGPYLRRSHNLSQGFQLYDDSAASLAHGAAHGDVTNPHMEAALLGFLKQKPDPSRPFFLFAYFWDPHFDFIPPAPYDELFQSEQCEPFDASHFDRNQEVRPGMSRARLDYLLSQYAGEIRATDDVLGRVFARLKELDLWDDALVMVTADHGEEFFDHGRKGHKNNLHAETVHVPLIVKYPRDMAPPVTAGSRDPRLASHVDVLPTLLELAGLSIPDELPGRSLLDMRPSGDRNIFYELRAIEYFERADGRVEGRAQDWVGAKRGRFKLIGGKFAAQSPFEFRLYDAVADASERFDRSGTEGEVVDDLRAAFASFLLEAREEAARHQPAGTVSLDEGEREQLCALGYLEC